MGSYNSKKRYTTIPLVRVFGMIVVVAIAAMINDQAFVVMSESMNTNKTEQAIDGIKAKFENERDRGLQEYTETIRVKRAHIAYIDSMNARGGKFITAWKTATASLDSTLSSQTSFNKSIDTRTESAIAAVTFLREAGFHEFVRGHVGMIMSIVVIIVMMFGCANREKKSWILWISIIAEISIAMIFNRYLWESVLPTKVESWIVTVVISVIFTLAYYHASNSFFADRQFVTIVDQRVSTSGVQSPTNLDMAIQLYVHGSDSGLSIRKIMAVYGVKKHVVESKIRALKDGRTQVSGHFADNIADTFGQNGRNGHHVLGDD